MRKLAKKRKGIPGVSFSWKRALGVTRAKQNFARKTGIPTSKAGLERKVGKAMLGGGCLMYIVAGVVAVTSFITFLI